MSLFLRSSKQNIGLSKLGCMSFSAAQTTTQYPNITNPLDGYELLNSRNKITIPALGFGTWGCEHFDHSTMAKSVDYALKIGYRHIDCARVYKNEKEIGQVLKDHFANGLKREDVFITSKLFNDMHAPPDGAPSNAIEQSLKDLDLDYLDAYLIHWPFRNTLDRPASPFNFEHFYFTYKILTELELRKLTKSVGVCNTTIFKLKELQRLCSTNNIKPPAINQVEMHPYLQQPKLLEYCNNNNIIITSAMPLGSPERPERFKRDDDPPPLQNKVINEVAKEAGCSPAQVIVRWHLQRGCTVIPKGTEEWMIKENFDVLKIVLNEDQMNRINKEDKHYRFARAEVYRWEENQPWEELWDYE